MARGETVRTIFIALAANVVISVAKLVAGIVSGSTAMLAESAHSFADSLNEVLLGISLRRAKRPADADHPFGHGRERFLWAFMAAIASFLLGGCLSVAMALRELSRASHSVPATSASVVLAIAFIADGTSLVQSVRQARREASERGRGVIHHLLRSSDPILRAIVVEDGAAILGLILAACGLLASHVTGNNKPDSIAALLIGVLLGATAFGLARPLADFLVGRSLPADELEKLQRMVAASPAVEELLSLHAVYIGPEEVIVAARIHPRSDLEIEELTRAMDDVDQALRAASPFVADVFLDVTTYRSDTRPKDQES